MMCSFGASGPSLPGSSVGCWTQTLTPWICALTNSLQPSVGVSVIGTLPDSCECILCNLRHRLNRVLGVFKVLTCIATFPPHDRAERGFEVVNPFLWYHRISRSVVTSCTISPV